MKYSRNTCVLAAIHILAILPFSKIGLSLGYLESFIIVFVKILNNKQTEQIPILYDKFYSKSLGINMSITS